MTTPNVVQLTHQADQWVFAASMEKVKEQGSLVVNLEKQPIASLRQQQIIAISMWGIR